MPHPQLATLHSRSSRRACLHVLFGLCFPQQCRTCRLSELRNLLLVVCHPHRCSRRPKAKLLKKSTKEKLENMSPTAAGPTPCRAASCRKALHVLPYLRKFGEMRNCGNPHDSITVLWSHAQEMRHRRACGKIGAEMLNVVFTTTRHSSTAPSVNLRIFQAFTCCTWFSCSSAAGCGGYAACPAAMQRNRAPLPPELCT